MSESFRDQLRRVDQMSVDDGNTWDLSENDQASLKALLASHADLLAACRAFVEAYEKSLQLEKTDVALRLARAALAKAEGHSIASTLEG